jgi:hypothetical protein
MRWPVSRLIADFEKTDGVKAPVDCRRTELIAELLKLVEAGIQRGDLRLKLRGC